MTPTEASVLQAFGLHRVAHFLSAEECASIIESSENRDGEPATIYDPQDREFVKPQTRLTTVVRLPPEQRAMLRQRLDEHLAHLASELAIDEPLRLDVTNLFRYEPGDFFARHRDANPGRASGRRISAVIMLSSPDSADRHSYDGGEFVVFPPGLTPEEARTTVGIPTRADVGELFFFDSTLYHEIKPVTAGARHTIVAWFVADS